MLNMITYSILKAHSVRVQNELHSNLGGRRQRTGQATVVFSKYLASAEVASTAGLIWSQCIVFDEIFPHFFWPW